jgi:hypothetical protein
MTLQLFAQGKNGVSMLDGDVRSLLKLHGYFNTIILYHSSYQCMWRNCSIYHCNICYSIFYQNVWTRLLIVSCFKTNTVAPPMTFLQVRCAQNVVDYVTVCLFILLNIYIYFLFSYYDNSSFNAIDNFLTFLSNKS